jgi:hypothetical protein
MWSLGPRYNFGKQIFWLLSLLIKVGVLTGKGLLEEIGQVKQIHKDAYCE